MHEAGQGRKGGTLQIVQRVSANYFFALVINSGSFEKELFPRIVFQKQLSESESQLLKKGLFLNKTIPGIIKQLVESEINPVPFEKKIVPK